MQFMKILYENHICLHNMKVYFPLTLMGSPRDWKKVVLLRLLFIFWISKLFYSSIIIGCKDSNHRCFRSSVSSNYSGSSHHRITKRRTTNASWWNGRNGRYGWNGRYDVKWSYPSTSWFISFPASNKTLVYVQESMYEWVIQILPVTEWPRVSITFWSKWEL